MDIVHTICCETLWIKSINMDIVYSYYPLIWILSIRNQIVWLSLTYAALGNETIETNVVINYAHRHMLKLFLVERM
jgi:hypothetical protein